MPDQPSGRYHIRSIPQAEFQPGSRGRVLLNKLGIRSKRQIDLAEYEALLREQSRYLAMITRRTRFDAALLRRMHRDWLGEIYPWAGDYRTVNLAKSGFAWPPALLVPDAMRAFERGALAEHTPCKPAGAPEVARGLAIIHAELLLIHPFREGNGRLARWLAEFMAYQAGLPRPRYRFVGEGGRHRFERYVDAVRKAYGQDYEALTAFFEEALERGLAMDREI